MIPKTGIAGLEEFRSEEGGVLAVDKPLDWTSFDVVKKVRGILRVKKVGHAGTLDPLATGLLILCSNRMTKSIDKIQSQRKTYEGTIVFGFETKSHDTATPPENPRPIDHLDLERIKEQVKEFTGHIEQVPPMFSALQIGGKRLYHLARKGETVDREPRPVIVFTFDITRYEAPDADFVVQCSKGTYVRSLAHDLGTALGCGAYLSALRRTSIGDYSVEDAWTLDDLQKAAPNRIQEPEIQVRV